MTEQEMKKRIQEIRKIRENLKRESMEYEKILYDKEVKKIEESRKNAVGKCFLTKRNPCSKHPEIYAFKILNISPAPNQNYAECAVIFEDDHFNTKLGVSITRLGLWLEDDLRMITRKDDPKMIDMYSEISSRQFDELWEKKIAEISGKKDHVF